MQIFSDEGKLKFQFKADNVVQFASWAMTGSRKPALVLFAVYSNQ
jgi:lipopolysaccharide export system protein LptC